MNAEYHVEYNVVVVVLETELKLAFEKSGVNKNIIV